MVDEATSRYEFSRHLFQVVVSWFTVFCTVNIAVFGWIATSVFKEHQIPGRAVGWLVCMMLFVQNILGIAACFALLMAMNKNQRRLSSMLDVSSNAHPILFYRCAVVLMMLACATYMLAWLLMPLLVSWK